MTYPDICKKHFFEQFHIQFTQSDKEKKQYKCKMLLKKLLKLTTKNTQ